MQGEGVFAGTPSVFLRTYYCNLTCVWCDTKYTWLDQDASKPGVDYHPMTAEEVLEKVTSYACRHLVVTGGEPLLHQRLLAPILSNPRLSGYFIEVETNGTIAPTVGITKAVDIFNVSPKTNSSGVNDRVRIRPESLHALVLSRRAWFKFVVCNPSDLAEIEELISGIGIPRERVLLMPEGTDAHTLLERSRWLIEVCKERGLRFAPRLHILLFGNKRGT